jgi:hypothetical protein
MGMGLRPSTSHDDDIVDDDGIPQPRAPVIQEEVKTLYDTKAEQRKRQLKEQADQPLNSICNCGSNKKYKHCCLKKL